MCLVKEEPLLQPAAEVPTLVALCWGSVSLYATTVGAGVLSVPISYAYCGSGWGASMLLVAFGALSAASLHFIAGAASRVGASSYLGLGERCFGLAGAQAVAKRAAEAAADGRAWRRRPSRLACPRALRRR